MPHRLVPMAVFAGLLLSCSAKDDELSTEETPGSCEGIVCETPPAATCDEADAIFISYASSGACVAETGECNYERTEIPCPSCRANCLGEEACPDASDPYTPDLPQQWVDPRYPDTTGYAVKTVKVTGGDFDDLQDAIDAMTCTTVLRVDAGYTVTLASGASITLPAKNCTGAERPVIESAALDALTEGVRVDPSSKGSMFVLRKVAGPEPALRAADQASGYYIAGLAVEIDPAVRLVYSAISIAPSTPTDPAAAPHHITLARSYIAGHENLNLQRGIYLDGAHLAIVDSDVREVHFDGNDAQAIFTYNAAGPLAILNNRLEGSGENFMAGGADPRIADRIPSDLEIRRNHFTKPMRWADPVIPAPENLAGTAVAGGALPATTTLYCRVRAFGTIATGATGARLGGTSLDVTVVTTATNRQLQATWTPPISAAPVTDYAVYCTADPAAVAPRTWTFDKIAAEDAGCATGTTCMHVFDGTNPTGTCTTGTDPTCPDNLEPKLGTKWTVKNLFELKNARRVLVDGNIFENNWIQSQIGLGILFTTRNQSGSCPWCRVWDVTFTNNEIRNSMGVFSTNGSDNNFCSIAAERWLIRNNIARAIHDVHELAPGNNNARRFISFGSSGKTGCADDLPGRPRWVTLDHNAVFSDPTITAVRSGITVPNGRTITDHRWTNNFFAGGVLADSVGFGDPALDNVSPLAIAANAIVGQNEASYDGHPGNFFPQAMADIGFVDAAACYDLSGPLTACALAASSAYQAGQAFQATDGAANGPNIPRILAAYTRDEYPCRAP